MKPKRILVIRLKQIGDAMLGLPVINSLKANYPDAEIDYLLYQHIAPLFAEQPAINRVISITPAERKSKWRYLKKVWWLRQQGYDMVLDLINVPITAITTFASGAPITLGFDKGKARKHLYKFAPVHLEQGDAAERKLRIIDALANTPAAPARLQRLRDWRLYFQPAEIDNVRATLESAGIKLDQPLVFIAATSRKNDKHWPADYFVKVIEFLQSQGLQLLFNWLPNAEGEFVEQLLAKLPSQRGLFSGIDLSLRDLAIAIGQCDFFFGNDGGPAHMAVGNGVPSLALYSPIHEKHSWLPKDKPQHQGIDICDVLPITEQQRRQQVTEIKQNLAEYYQHITPEIVIEKLRQML